MDDVSCWRSLTLVGERRSLAPPGLCALLDGRLVLVVQPHRISSEVKLTHCPRAFSTYAARLSASSCRSQLNNGFQLVKMRLTSFRSAFARGRAAKPDSNSQAAPNSLRSRRPRRKQISVGVQRRRASQVQKQNPIARRELLVPNHVNQARHGFAFINRI